MNVDASRSQFAEISTAFPTVPESVAAARRFVAASLRRFDFSVSAIEQAALATSELVAGAFAAGHPPIRIRVRSIADGRASVEVTHGIDGTQTEPDALDHGLHLTTAGRTVVEAMVTRWGSRPISTGGLAWFEIDDPIRPGTVATAGSS